MPRYYNEFKKLIFKLEDQGWIVRVTPNGHALAKGPDGQFTVTIAMGGDPRSIKNAIARLRRCGAKL